MMIRNHHKREDPFYGGCESVVHNWLKFGANQTRLHANFIV